MPTEGGKEGGAARIVTRAPVKGAAKDAAGKRDDATQLLLCL